VAETRDLLHARPLSGHEDEVVAARVTKKIVK